jgi:hypothetical protein
MDFVCCQLAAYLNSYISFVESDNNPYASMALPDKSDLPEK